MACDEVKLGQARQVWFGLIMLGQASLERERQRHKDSQTQNLIFFSFPDKDNKTGTKKERDNNIKKTVRQTYKTRERLTEEKKKTGTKSKKDRQAQRERKTDRHKGKDRHI